MTRSETAESSNIEPEHDFVWELTHIAPELQAQYEAEAAAERAAIKAEHEKRHAAYLTELAKTRECPRCSGRGYLNGYEHIDGGRCFRCGGAGRILA